MASSDASAAIAAIGSMDRAITPARDADSSFFHILAFILFSLPNKIRV